MTVHPFPLRGTLSIPAADVLARAAIEAGEREILEGAADMAVAEVARERALARGLDLAEVKLGDVMTVEEVIAIRERVLAPTTSDGAAWQGDAVKP